MARSSPARFALAACAVAFAMMLAAATPAQAACRQIGNADYCTGDAQSKCCRSIDNHYFYGCTLYNNNEMCPYDRALQTCCSPSMGRRLLGSESLATRPAPNATLARPTSTTVKETVEVRITAKPKQTERSCLAACKAN